MADQSFGRGGDWLIARLAARQHGVVARRQLLGAGLTRHEIHARLRNGRLHEIHRGVYLVGHTVPTPHGREAAALLACGAGAVLSHRTAAALWGLLEYRASARVCVTVPPHRAIDRAGIEVHRSALESRDIRLRHGLPVTSPPRTILDLAARCHSEDLERLVAEASFRRLASESELRKQLECHPGRRGSAALRDILELPGRARHTRSPAERRMLRLLREEGLSGYEVNARIHGYEVDVLWRAHDFAVEIDGYDAHSGRVAFERDRLKIATLNAHGLTVMPVTGRQLRDGAIAVRERLLRALKLAGYRS